MNGNGTIQTRGKEVFLAVGREWYHFDSSQTPLGAGAMGTVYFGRNCRNSHDLVAIKHVNPAYSSIPSIRERARLEASLAFNHHNLVEMVGLCEDGNLNGPMFIISRLVQGTTLDKFVERTFNGRPDRVQRIVRCILPVLDALDYIHSKNIIHLDIKPSNIMVENSSNIRLMDLGIAFTKDTPSTNSSGLLGTPGYAAPEQYIQKGVQGPPFNRTTDIYQLGATLYELIGGKKPFEEAQVLLPLPGVNKRLMKAIAKSLEYYQSDRYASAREFSAALTDALNHKSWWNGIFK